jgi:hypothetical protein
MLSSRIGTGEDGLKQSRACAVTRLTLGRRVTGAARGTDPCGAGVDQSQSKQESPRFCVAPVEGVHRGFSRPASAEPGSQPVTLRREPVGSVRPSPQARSTHRGVCERGHMDARAQVRDSLRPHWLNRRPTAFAALRSTAEQHHVIGAGAKAATTVRSMGTRNALLACPGVWRAFFDVLPRASWCEPISAGSTAMAGMRGSAVRSQAQPRPASSLAC